MTSPLAGAAPFIVLDEIVAELFAVAEIVHCAFDLYLTRVDESPVKAIVVVFVSTTVPDTVGAQLAAAAVIVIDVLFDPRLKSPLNVSQVNVHVAVFALGI